MDRMRVLSFHLYSAYFLSLDQLFYKLVFKVMDYFTNKICQVVH